MAGEYIEFNNNSQPALNDVNINRLQQLIKQDIQGAVSGDTLPVGAIMPFGSDTIPDNWLLCDGSAVSRTTYQQLFNTIGTTYGTGDGFTTFNLPNLQGKIPVGKNANDTDFDTLGETGGEKTHTLTINEMPSHNHQREQTGRALYWDENLTEIGGLTSGVNVQISWNRDTTNTGGSQPHNNLQPYIVQNYIIKAKQSAGIVATVVDGLNSTSATNALSANQGRRLNDKFSKSVITAGPNTELTSITTRDQIIPLTSSTIVGDKLQISATNNGIKVGNGVSKVKISANVFYQDYDSSVAYVFPSVTINDNRVAMSISSRDWGTNTLSYQSVTISPFIIEVNENDVIKLTSGEINPTQEGNIRGLRLGVLNTYITVEVVE